MDGKGVIAAGILIVLALASSCARPDYQYKHMPYYPADEMPREVYVEDQVNPLNTNGALPEENRVIVEVRTIEGRQEKGRLIRISERDILLSPEFRYVAEGDTTGKEEKVVTIPKEEVLILKVW